MKKSKSTYYKTRDFEEALVMQSAGAILETIEWDGMSKVGIFVFENEKMCREILDKHKRKELRLLSQDVLNSYRNIKNELFRVR